MLSGEAIIFQNETHDIFRDVINASESPLDPPARNESNATNDQVAALPKLKVRFVMTILLEFLRSVLEN